MTTAIQETAPKKNGKGVEAAAKAPEAPKMPTVITGGKRSMNIVMVPLKDLLITQSDNNRSDEIDLSSPDPDFVLLALNIREKGLLHPPTVEPTGNGKYKVIAGYRRSMAHHGFSAELSDSANVAAKGSENLRDIVVVGEGGKFKFEPIDPVPCVVMEPKNDYERTVLRGIENVDREDLNGYEMAKLVWSAQDTAKAAKIEKKVVEIARDLGMSRPHASNLLATRDLIPKWMTAFKDGTIRMTDAFRYCRMSKEEQKTAYEVWEMKRGGGSEGGDEGGEEGGAKEPKMLRKDKVEELLGDVDLAEKMRIGGKWVEMTTEMKKIAAAAIKFILKPSKNKPLFQVPEPEIEEEEEEEGEEE